jgi:hypothetical protein
MNLSIRNKQEGMTHSEITILFNKTTLNIAMKSVIKTEIY